MHCNGRHTIIDSHVREQQRTRTCGSPCTAIASMKARMSLESVPAAAACAARGLATLAGHARTATAAANARRRERGIAGTALEEALEAGQDRIDLPCDQHSRESSQPACPRSCRSSFYMNRTNGIPGTEIDFGAVSVKSNLPYCTVAYQHGLR